jgi:hypothetical protein
MVSSTIARRERPVGVAVIALFNVAGALVALGQLVVDVPYLTTGAKLAEVHPAMPALIVFIAVLRLAAAAGLWMGSRRAWVLTMLIVGVGLLGNLWLFAMGEPAYLAMAVDVVIAFYLNQGAVRDYFERRPAPFEDARATVPGGAPDGSHDQPGSGDG